MTDEQHPAVQPPEAGPVTPSQVEAQETATTAASETATSETAASETAASQTAASQTAATPGPALPAPDYNQAGVPSLDFVRDKIEGRYAKSLGSAELAQETPEARSFEEAAAKREEAARDKLDEIRRSLRGDSKS